MRHPWPRVAFFSLVSVSVIIACGGGSTKPGAGVEDNPGNGDASYPTVTRDGSAIGDSGGDGSPDAEPVPATCANTIKDGSETDVDCGGNICGKCIDGKACIAVTDCAGGSCLNQKCATPKCSDSTRNGDESDVDCGGSVCAKCTIGKRCAAGTDCVSGTCDGDACACPPGMASVSKASGGAYCIDQVEVTKGQYNKFITANVPISAQSGVCLASNATFVPRGAWPPAEAPPFIQPTGRPFSYSLPVHYVDWCDAYAYCTWANKQLCGKINGGPLTPDAGNSDSTSAWYNACSAQGTKSWPYGNVFDDAKCNGTGSGLPGPAANQPPGDGYGFTGSNQDDGVYTDVTSDNNGNFTVIEHAECQGGSTSVYHMSGNVAEWEDNCDGPGASSNCALRGGSYTAGAGNSAPLSCAAVRTEQRLPPSAASLADVGFRCCIY